MFQIDSHGVCGFRRSGLVSFSIFNRYLPPLPYLLCIKVVGGGGVKIMGHCYWYCSKTTEILIEDAATTTMYGRLEKSLCTVAVAEAFLVRRGWKNKIQQQGGLPTTTASFVCVQVERLRRQLGRSGGGGLSWLHRFIYLSLSHSCFYRIELKLTCLWSDCWQCNL